METTTLYHVSQFDNLDHSKFKEKNMENLEKLRYENRNTAKEPRIEKELHQIGTLNNAYSAWFLTEDGVYEVLMQSRKPIAKHFKKEVKAVLKSIRKHGAYMTTETLEQALLNPDTMIKLCMQLKEEQNKNKPFKIRLKRIFTFKTSYLQKTRKMPETCQTT